MAAFQFGAGELWGTDLSATPNVPVKFGAVQDVSLDFQFSVKELYSSNQFPVALGRGTGKINGKANSAQILGQEYGRLFFNQAPSTGMHQTVSSEAQAVPGTPYQVTVTHATGFLADLGVRYAATGIPLTPVTSAPALGQYSVNVATGVYTFAAADTLANLLFDYTYNQTTSGNLVTITNQLLGLAPQFKINLKQVFTYLGTTKELSLQLNACMSSKLSLATKLDNFLIPSFDFSAFADASGTIGYLSTTE